MHRASTGARNEHNILPDDKKDTDVAWEVSRAPLDMEGAVISNVSLNLVRALCDLFLVYSILTLHPPSIPGGTRCYWTINLCRRYYHSRWGLPSSC